MAKSPDKANATLSVRMSEENIKRFTARAMSDERKVSWLANRTLIRWLDGRLLEIEKAGEAGWINVGPETAAAWNSLTEENDFQSLLNAIKGVAEGRPVQALPKQHGGRTQNTPAKSAKS